MVRKEIRRVYILFLAQSLPMYVESRRNWYSDFAVSQQAQTERDGTNKTGEISSFRLPGPFPRLLHLHLPLIVLIMPVSMMASGLHADKVAKTHTCIFKILVNQNRFAVMINGCSPTTLPSGKRSGSRCSPAELHHPTASTERRWFCIKVP
jgi:hypothetical protein